MWKLILHFQTLGIIIYEFLITNLFAHFQDFYEHC